jgi:hypothetical protein
MTDTECVWVIVGMIVFLIFCLGFGDAGNSDDEDWH